MRRSARLAVTVVTALTLSTPGAVAAQAAPAPRPTPPPPPPVSLAPTPPMGFNDWNAFGCDVNAQLIEETADVFVSSGLKALGYQYVNIDDCWSLKERGADVRLVPDPAKFPDGIKGVADYVHAKGLKLGIYGDAGTKTCAGYPGSLGHEDVDAKTWADWGVDYLKYDNCNNASDGSQADFVRRYTAMRTALDKAGRPIVYSICEWGQSKPWTWAGPVGDLWRTGGDISDNWPTLRSIIAANAKLAPYAGPGDWNDPDMLEIGNGGMTDTEYRTHMSMWAMMAAPLIIGTDLRTATPATLAILGNREVIAIDQDRLGVQGRVVSDAGGLMVLDKPLADGDRAIALHNSTDALATVSVPAAATGLGRARAYRLTDVWSGTSVQAATTISAAVPAHGTVVYRVRPLRPEHADPKPVAPSVTVGAAVGTLIPGDTPGATLSTTVTNRGAGPVAEVQVSVSAPDGWTVTPAGRTRTASLGTDRSFASSWTVAVPADARAGTYPITVGARYGWGGRHRATTSSVVVGTVVVAPPDGRRWLSTLPWVSAENGSGPVERDSSNGTAAIGDGSLITIAGTVHTRGLGTHAAATISYYLGGTCTAFDAQVGIDDESSAGSARFQVVVDDTVAADSGVVTAQDEARPVHADLTGARWLRLVTDPDGSADGDAADWADAVLTCGANPGEAVLPAERTLFGFEDGTEGFTLANPGDGGTMAQTTAFHTEGGHGLAADPPQGGNWFGTALRAAPLDLTGASTLKFDVRGTGTGTDSGTTGEIAIQVGPETTWCQGGLWAWTGTGQSRTIKERVQDITCPAGVELDLSQVTGFWVFLNGDAVIDNIRVE